MSEKDVWQEEGKEVVITALTTAVAIGVGILMHKDN